MGAVNPSKMPNKKTVVRKDNPNDVEVYKRGGKVKKYANEGRVMLDLPSQAEPIQSARDLSDLESQNEMGSKKGGPVGLYANIHAKQERIKHGSKEKMRKPGSKGAPSKQDFINSAKTRKKK